MDRAEHDYAPWEKRVDAILRLLADSKRRILRVDELRRGIEHRVKAMAVIGMSIGASFALAMVLGPVLNTWIGVPGIF